MEQRAVLVGAAISVVLLLNAFSLAPLLHHHGDLHNTQNCLICSLHATGNVVPPPPRAVPQTTLSGLQPPLSGTDLPASEFTLAILIRGPPSAQIHLI